MGIEESRKPEESHKMAQLSNLNGLFQQSRPSVAESLPCAHKNGGSAVSPTRNSPYWAAQYTHLLWVMPWTNSHSMLSKIWTVTSRSTQRQSYMSLLRMKIFSLINGY